MSRFSPVPPPESPAEIAYKRDRALLRALYTCQPVMVDGKYARLHSMYPQVSGGGIDTHVYLMNDPVSRQASEVTFPELPE